MTEKLNIQSSRYLPFLVIILAILLVALFVLAITIEANLFFTLAVGLLVSLLTFLSLHNRFIHKKAEVELQHQDLVERLNLTQSEIDLEEKTIEGIKEKIKGYDDLKDLMEKLSMSLSLDETSHTLSSEVQHFFGHAETIIIIYLLHARTGELGISTSQKGEAQINIKSKKGDVFDEWVVRTLQPLLIEDTKKDFRFDSDIVKSEDDRLIRSLISVPLLVGHKAHGILRIDSSRPDHFTTEDLRFLTTVGEIGALAIENAQLYEHLEELAIKDGLTNLYLRRYFLERLGEEIARHLRHKNECSLLMVDLDKFKEYNDHFGHQAGDIVLKTLSSILTDSFHRPGDVICRYGGEEFAVLLPDCPKDKAVMLAASFRKAVEEKTVLLRREKMRITVSIGVATFPTDAPLREELIHKADQALYQAKNKGRNRVCAAS